MLYYLLYAFRDYVSPFNVFRYITFRTAVAIITSMAITFLLAPETIKFLKRISLTQQIRNDGPQSHLSKAGTPTMGGVLIIISTAVSILLWGNLSNRHVWIMLISTICVNR
ncbi:MAG: hypothetical protein HQK92_11500 [Nitrospirae bacterium]|nr:hypothetical protein [Nitrospirota bacterium]